MTQELSIPKDRREFLRQQYGGDRKQFPDLFDALDDLDTLEAELAKGGPLTSERWTLDELLAELEKWKAIAGGKTCVSFENICFGASSLWHQTHRENFRKVDRKPEALSQWMLKHDKCVQDDFPAQVLAKLESLSAQLDAARLSGDKQC